MNILRDYRSRWLGNGGELDAPLEQAAPYMDLAQADEENDAMSSATDRQGLDLDSVKVT